MDAYDRFWQWAEKPRESADATGGVASAVMELAPEDRRDREKVNEAAARRISDARSDRSHES